MKDYVYPDENEQEYIAIAESYGYSEIVFIYKKKTSKRFVSKIKVTMAYESDKVERKGSLMFYRGKKIREAISSSKIDAVIGSEDQDRDFLHHRNSGLNHILCNLAAEKHTYVAFDFGMLSRAKPERKAVILGRMKQNLMLCRKAKANIIVASFAKRPSEMARLSEIMKIIR